VLLIIRKIIGGKKKTFYASKSMAHLLLSAACSIFTPLPLQKGRRRILECAGKATKVIKSWKGLDVRLHF